MWRSRTKLAKVFLVFFVISLIASYTLIFASFNHECVGEHCNICYGIDLLKNNFDILSIMLSSIVIYAIKSCIVQANELRRLSYRLTPVRLKVEMTE